MAAAIPFPAPTGFRWVPIERDGDWRPVTGKRCRRILGGKGRERVHCGKPSALEINRGRQTKTRGVIDSWWAYCPEHAYRNWVEDGKVWGWRLVPNEVAS